MGKLHKPKLSRDLQRMAKQFVGAALHPIVHNSTSSGYKYQNKKSWARVTDREAIKKELAVKKITLEKMPNPKELGAEGLSKAMKLAAR